MTERALTRKPVPPLVRKRHTVMQSIGGDAPCINLAWRRGRIGNPGNTETHKQG